MDFIKGSVVTLSYNILQLFLGLITGLILLPRLLGPEGKGIYTILALIPGMLYIIGNFGIDPANTYHVASKKYSPRDISTNSIILAFAIMIIFIIIFVPTHNIIQYNFLKLEPKYFNMLILALIATFFLFLARFFGSVVYGKNKIGQYNLIIFFPMGFSFLVLIILWQLNIFWRPGILNPSSAFMAMVGGYVISSFVALVLTLRISPIGVKPNISLFKDTFSYGSKTYTANLFQQFNLRLDYFLVQAFVNAQMVGFYSVAVSMAELPWQIPNSVSTVLFPKISGSSDTEAKEITPKVCRQTFLITILATLVLAFLGKIIITLLPGKSFEPALMPFYLLLPGIVFIAPGKVLASDLAGRGKPIYAAITSGICLVVTIVLDLILIPFYQAVGAAIASSIAYTLNTVLFLIFFKRETGIGAWNTLVFKMSDLKDYFEFFRKKIRSES